MIINSEKFIIFKNLRKKIFHCTGNNTIFFKSNNNTLNLYKYKRCKRKCKRRKNLFLSETKQRNGKINLTEKEKLIRNRRIKNVWCIT